ncbi:hypothetical protein Bca101_085644 [Brassica carinata]
MVMWSLHRIAGFSSASTPDVRVLTLASGDFVYVCLGWLLFRQAAALKALIFAGFRLFDDALRRKENQKMKGLRWFLFRWVPVNRRFKHVFRLVG